MEGSAEERKLEDLVRLAGMSHSRQRAAWLVRVSLGELAKEVVMVVLPEELGPRRRKVGSVEEDELGNMKR
jgi:hypothetical protein